MNVISKSGGTLETAVAFRILLADLLERHGDGARDRVVVTTETGSPLHRLAERYGFASFSIPVNVGGRYSVLTPVGLLPGAVVGIDVGELLAGAAEMAMACEEAALEHNPAYLYAALQYLAYREVEAYKNYMFGILGREDRRAYRERFEARPADRPEFVCGNPDLLPHA